MDEKLIPEELERLREMLSTLHWELMAKAQGDEKLKGVIKSVDSHCARALDAVETSYEAMVWMSYCSGSQLSALYGERAQGENIRIH